MLFWPSQSFSQWKKIFTYGGTVYFKPFTPTPKDGFVGRGSTLWRTLDGGKTWKKNNAVFFEYITDIVFKDKDTGWLTCNNISGSSDTVVPYKTIDGGDVWFPMVGANGYADNIHYDKDNNRLFIPLQNWKTNHQTIYSDDEGATWKPLTIGHQCLTISFVDGMNGLMINAGQYRNTGLQTTDGGNTWNDLSKWFASATKATPIHNSGTYLIPEFRSAPSYPDTIFRTDDFGKTWYPTVLFQSNNPPCAFIAGDSNKLYLQASLGVYKSNDTGKSWISICGPPDYAGWNQTYSSGDVVYASNANDLSLWLNVTGKPNGPRLQIHRNNITQSSAEALIAIEIDYPSEAYYDNVDSLTFLVRYKGDMLGFEQLTVASGWKKMRCTSTDSSVTCVMKYIGIGQPALNSPIVTVSFRAYVSKDTMSTVTLDEINFNQDTTFRDCMIASLSASDTVHVSLASNCGDSILRKLLVNNQSIVIESISPSPARDEIEADLHSSKKQNAQVEIFDALGVKVFSEMRSITEGSNAIHLDTKGLSGGMYLVRVGEASQSFVKVK